MSKSSSSAYDDNPENKQENKQKTKEEKRKTKEERRKNLIESIEVLFGSQSSSLALDLRHVIGSWHKLSSEVFNPPALDPVKEIVHLRQLLTLLDLVKMENILEIKNGGKSELNDAYKRLKELLNVIVYFQSFFTTCSCLLYCFLSPLLK